MRRYGLLKRPHIYLSIGLPERLKNMARINPRAHRRYMYILSAVDHFIAFGWAEATELRNLFTKPVSFIPFGVNTHFFHPNHPPLPTSVDILSIGADSQRDFPILLEFAKRNPHRSIQMIVSGTHANQLKNHPPNIKLAQALPISDVCSHIASARLIVLPVRENTYSGATTTLLQCMAMEKAVVVSRVGAIRDGYGFKDGVNLRFVEPSDISEMSRVINEMLAQDVQNAMMPKAARLHVQGHLNWQQFVESMNQVMRLVAQL
jgi:glycosyltransferase involved in cell wall biosynthesis